MAVPLFDTRTPLQPLRGEIEAAIGRVLDSGKFILGPQVAAFEREFADYCGAAHGVGVANGTDALTIALRAMGVGPGDEVVVPSFTFYASAEAIPPTGATPVFCDIDPATYCVTADTVRPALTPRTKAVIAVHLFGNLAPVAEIEALGVPVLEDAAQAAGSWLRGGGPDTQSEAMGAPGGTLAQAGHARAHTAGTTDIAGRSPIGRPGALGTAATWSFFPSKNLGCFGDGGMITTSSPEIAERAGTLRFHGSRDKVTYDEVGYNSRLDELQAAILRVQLPHLDDWADGRRTAGARYEAAGLGELVALPEPTASCGPAWHLYVVRRPEVDRLADALTRAGIGCKAYYRTPVHRQPAMRQWGTGIELPGTEEAARTHLAIPMSPVLTQAQVGEVVAGVRGSFVR